MKKLIVVVVVFMLFISGCTNFYGWVHKKGEGDADSLIADARAAMTRGEYNNAVSYYAKAMELDSRKSKARYGHAVAYIKSIRFNVVTLANRLNYTSSTPVDFINPSDFGLSTLSDLEQLVDTLLTDLDPIRGGICDGVISPTDAEVNLTISISKILKAGVLIKKLSGSHTLFINPDGTFTIDPLLTSAEALEILNLIIGDGGAKEAFDTALTNSGVNVSDPGYSDVDDVLTNLKNALTIL
ncbi:MAG: hypothetical protein ABH873_06955 [Candidatus Firestonebacteria bacterium]